MGSGFNGWLVADAELLDKIAIAGEVFLHQIGEKTTAPVDQCDQTTLGAEVLLVDLHVLGQLKNPSCEYGNLDFARTAVLLVKPVLFNQFGFRFFVHFQSLTCRTRQAARAYSADFSAIRQ